MDKLGLTKKMKKRVVHQDHAIFSIICQYIPQVYVAGAGPKA